MSKEVYNKPWLLIDVPNLSWRAHYSTGQMSYNDKPTGVIYGVLRELRQLEQRFGSHRPVFCFDLGRPKRCELYPDYKANRVLDEKRKQVRRQTQLLRTEILPAVGYKNLLAADGYEADDLIAECCLNHLHLLKHSKVIVSGDKDLYQLLGITTVQYHPVSKKLYTVGLFREEYGIRPEQWPLVKAIAGCETDNVKGVKGVGEKTAIKAALSKSGLIPPTLAKTALRNLPLVRLPFPDVPDFDLRDDEVTEDGWYEMTRKYGIRSL